MKKPFLIQTFVSKIVLKTSSAFNSLTLYFVKCITVLTVFLFTCKRRDSNPPVWLPPPRVFEGCPLMTWEKMFHVKCS